ncbi:MAG: hypothetical protein ACK6DA_14990 [Candidatus Kapaibacterium sp.]|jgi:16S rRNA C1402 N4-methylase RsmH|nr:hypothetical protein [Cryomorphaceae bacterium]
MTIEYDVNQARKTAYEVKLKIVHEELQEVIQKIKEAAEEGMRGIYIDLSTYTQTIEELKKRGFGVQESNNKWWVGW